MSPRSEWNFFEWEAGSLELKARVNATVNDTSVVQSFQLLRLWDRQVHFPLIIRLKEKALTADLNDDERDRIFQFAELVAFAGLSVREYFGLGVTYCNSHNFAPAIQTFCHEASGAAIITRRRDGNSLGYISADAFKEIKPLHVTDPMGLKLDSALLTSLLTAAEPDAALVEAIASFVRANTDSNHVSPHQEPSSLTSKVALSLRSSMFSEMRFLNHGDKGSTPFAVIAPKRERCN